MCSAYIPPFKNTFSQPWFFCMFSLVWKYTVYVLFQCFSLKEAESLVHFGKDLKFDHRKHIDIPLSRVQFIRVKILYIDT